MKELMDRRNFLKAALLTGAGSVLAACDVNKKVNAAVAQTLAAQPSQTPAVEVVKETQEIVKEVEVTRIVEPSQTATVENTATKEAIATSEATSTPAVKETAMNGVEAYQVVETETQENWTINWTDVAQKDRGDGTTFEQWAKATYPKWGEVKPELWPTAPNVPNPLVPEFRVKQIVVDGKTVDTVPDGMEIPDSGVRNFCEVVAGEQCTTPIDAGAYFEYTGDGEIPGLWKSKDGMGNTLLIVNVGDVTSGLTGTFLQGWALKNGRYFNGDTLPVGIVASVSHADNNMLNLKSKLNPNDGLPNAGANCSVREGCKKVHNTVIIMSGGAPLLIADSEVSK